MKKLYASQPTSASQSQPSPSQAGSSSNGGGFASKLIGKIHYDTESPVQKMDVGGADQALRLVVVLI